MRFERSSGLCRFSDSTLCSCAQDAGSSFDALEADEFTFLLVPETESKAFKSFDEGEGLHILENLVGVVAGLEIVVRDTRAEVMDVVEADISGEPLEDFGKLVKGASFESGVREVPVVFAFPINAFELVLDVEEPDTGDRSDANGRQLNEEVGEPSEDQDERDREQADRKVHRPDGSPEAGFCAGGGEAFADDEEVEGGKNEEDERVSHRTVDEALP